MRPKSLLLLLLMLPALLAPNGFAMLLCLCVTPRVEQHACCVRTCCEEEAPANDTPVAMAPCDGCCHTLSNPEHGSQKADGPSRCELAAPLFLPATGPAAVVYTDDSVRDRRSSAVRTPAPPIGALRSPLRI